MGLRITTQILGIVLVAALAVAGCKHNNATGGEGDASAVLGATWRLAAFQRPGGAEEAVKPAPPYTVQFGADGRMSGQAHCNRHTGQYELLPSGGVKLAAGATTRMMCLGESIADEFLKTLGTVTRYRLDGGKLILSSDAGAVLTFAAAVPAVAYACPDGTEFSVAADEDEAAVTAPASLGGRSVKLPSVRAASGARYEKDGDSFWSHGDEAMFEVGGRSFHDCKKK
ncbi:MAG: META domain-containing protein [Acidobacteriota bacterium]|jgi:heat shock protein HslJ|nr:META domain-containing protein [Acidobacteriota bacterium]